MKFIFSKYALALMFIFCLCIKVQSQEMPKGYKVNIEMNIDEKGDVALDINAKYNATWWDAVKQNHGSDPSVLKNIWKKEFPKYVLTDFSFPNADIDQTINSKFKVLGMMKVDANGKWVAQLDQKDPNITKITDNSFLLVDEATAQTIKLNLPKSASDAKVEKDSFGKAILTYSAPVSGGGLGNIIKYLGILVVAGGGFLFFKGRGLNTVVVSDNKNKKIDYHQTKKIDDAVVINTPAAEPVRTPNTTTNGIDSTQE